MPSGRITYETSIFPRAGSATSIDCDHACLAAAVPPSLETDVPEVSDDLLRNLQRYRFCLRNRRQPKNPKFHECQHAFRGFGNGKMQKIANYLEKFSRYSQHEVLRHNKCRHIARLQAREQLPLYDPRVTYAERPASLRYFTGRMQINSEGLLRKILFLRVLRDFRWLARIERHGPVRVFPLPAPPEFQRTRCGLAVFRSLNLCHFHRYIQHPWHRSHPNRHPANGQHQATHPTNR